MGSSWPSIHAISGDQYADPNKTTGTYYSAGPTNFGSFASADESAGFQLAVWEIWFDDGLSLSAGTFRATSSPAVLGWADLYLGAAAGGPTPDGWTFYDFTNDSYQDYLSVTYTTPASSGSLRFTPVPNANGTATVTVTVNDNGASNENSNGNGSASAKNKTSFVMPDFDEDDGDEASGPVQPALPPSIGGQPHARPQTRGAKAFVYRELSATAGALDGALARFFWRQLS